MKLLRILLVLTFIWIQDAQTLGRNEKSDIIQNGHVAVTRNVLHDHQLNSDGNTKSVILRRYKKYDKGPKYGPRGRGIYETDGITDYELLGSYLSEKIHTGPKDILNKKPTKPVNIDGDKLQLLKFGTNPKAIYLYLPFEMIKNAFNIL